MILLELNEFALYAIEQQFAERFPDLSIVCAIGDVKSAVRVGELLNTYRPSMVFHAAAYKHVPLMESENAWQAVLNNVLGTKFKIISGYRGANDVYLALERGEPLGRRTVSARERVRVDAARDRDEARFRDVRVMAQHVVAHGVGRHH